MSRYLTNTRIAATDLHRALVAARETGKPIDLDNLVEKSTQLINEVQALTNEHAATAAKEQFVSVGVIPLGSISGILSALGHSWDCGNRECEGRAKRRVLVRLQAGLLD